MRDTVIFVVILSLIIATTFALFFSGCVKSLGAPMTKPDRAALQVAAAVLYSASLLATWLDSDGSAYFSVSLLVRSKAPLLATWLEADGSPYFSMRSLVRSSSAGRSINFGLSVSECLPFAASRRPGPSRN